MMTEEGDYDLLHARLQEWGLWINKCIESQANGHRKKSTIVSALEGSRSTAPVYPPDNSRAEEIEAIMMQIKIRHSLYAAVLKQEYCEPGTGLEKARRVGRSRSFYYDNLKMAMAMVEGILMGKYGYRKEVERLAKNKFL